MVIAAGKRPFEVPPGASPTPATALILEDLLMTDAVKVGFVPFSTAPRGILVVFCDDTLKLGATTRKVLGTAADLVKRAAATSHFKGKSGSTLDILAPGGLKVSRLIVVGAGKLSDLKEKDFLKFGGGGAGNRAAGAVAAAFMPELRG